MTQTHPIYELLRFHRPSHSKVQMDHFITQKTGGTPYGMFKQALRELSSRWHALRGYKIDLAELEETLDNMQDSPALPGFSGPYRQQRMELKLEGLRETIKEACREAQVFFEQAMSFRQMLPDDLNEDVIERLELEYWEHYLTKQMALEQSCHHTVSVNTLDAVLSMPKEARVRLINLRNDVTKLNAFLLNPEAPQGSIKSRLNGHRPVAIPRLTQHQIMELVE